MESQDLQCPPPEISEEEERREGTSGTGSGGGGHRLSIACTVAARCHQAGGSRASASATEHVLKGVTLSGDKSGLSFASLLPPSRPLKNIPKHLLLATEEVMTVVEFTTQSTQGPQNNLFLARSTLTLLHVE